MPIHICTSSGLARLRARFLGGGLALALGLSFGAPAARADDLLPLNPFMTVTGDGSGTAELARVLLPYSPLVFDFVVAFSRSIVEITYDSRAYDPLTQTFVLQGLKIARGDFAASARRVRIGASTSTYEGVSVDTRRLTLEPALREALTRLGTDVVSGDFAVSIDSDTPSASYDIDVVADLDRIGRLSFAAGVSGFHVLVPLDRAMQDIDGDGDADALPDTTVNDQPQVVGTLRHATVSFDDAGVADAAFAFAEEAQNLSKTEIQGLVGATLVPVVTSLFQQLPGGASPELERRAAEWSATMQAFLAEPGHLEITLRPQTPFDLAQLQAGPVTAAAIEALNPDVSRVPTGAPALIDPAAPAPDVGGVPMSRRLVEGLGVPQDIPAGVRMALGDAVLGDETAVDIAVRGIVLDPQSAIALEDATDPYALLLLAKARGVKVPESVLAAFAERLPAETVAAGEDKALAQWNRTEAGRTQAETLRAAIAARDWSAIRKLAYDHYEGDVAPRNLTEAYALAQVAAAGGDRIAADLRDRLRGATAGKTILFPIEAGKAKGDALWREVLAATPAPAEEPAAPPEPQTAPAAPDAVPAPPAVEDTVPAAPDEMEPVPAVPGQPVPAEPATP